MSNRAGTQLIYVTDRTGGQYRKWWDFDRNQIAPSPYDIPRELRASYKALNTLGISPLHTNLNVVVKEDVSAMNDTELSNLLQKYYLFS